MLPATPLPFSLSGTTSRNGSSFRLVKREQMRDTSALLKSGNDGYRVEEKKLGEQTFNWTLFYRKALLQSTDL